MKPIVLSLLLASSVAHASCGDLDIQIVNNSSHTCTFKNKILYYGTLANENVPSDISSGQSSPIFTARQDNVGIGILLTYKCDNEIVKFYSWQEYCGFFGGAGYIGGQPMASTTLNLDYSAQSGSYMTGRPGKITWRIS